MGKPTMLVNADFSKIAIVMPQHHQWIKSPGGEVERVMLDRIGAESARATSLVKYLPHTVFPQHQHPNGEEILVLSGVFTENSTTHYPAGWYLRSPHNSSHTPSSEQGALIFVKLRQMDLAETELVRIDTNDTANWQNVDNRFICQLFQSEQEHTYLEKLEPEQMLVYPIAQGIEILVTSGTLNFTDADNNNTVLEKNAWIRIPPHVTQSKINSPNATANFQAGANGASLYIKTNHLIAAAANTAKYGQ